MTKHSITAVFDDRSHADQAVAQLKQAGVPAGDITQLPAAGEGTTYTTAEDGKQTGFWASLEQLFGGTDDRATYAESIRRGGIMVSVRAEDAQLDRIVDILEQHGSVDMDERETNWRSEGWTGGAAAGSILTSEQRDHGGLGIDSPGMTSTGMASTGMASSGLASPGMTSPGMTEHEPVLLETSRTASAATDAGTVSRPVERQPAAQRTGEMPSTGVVGKMRDAADDVIQVVEERLDIGKRSASRGKVRVRTSVVSKDVSEDVTLHHETVSVDRRPVDRPMAALERGVDPFQERTIEMEEFAEEAVVGKTAHVVEEIGISKQHGERVETVHDSVRSTKVDIDDGRTGQTAPGLRSAFGDKIRADMEVVGSDGAHVGTVDHMDGERIKLKKMDPAAGGQHHFLAQDLVKSVNGKVMLAMTAAEAKQRWTAA